MRNMIGLFGLAMALTMGSTTFAADAAKDTAKEVKKPEGTEASFKGHLAKGDAGVAVLNVTNDDAKAAKKKVVLFAEGDLATQVADLLKKHSSVEVSGLLAPDGINMKLAKIEAVKEAKKTK